MITIIDYGASNLRSVVNAFDKIGCPTRVTQDAAEIAHSSALVLPGVGAFGDGISSLRRLNLIDALNAEVIQARKPYLGICLGLQFIAERSYEHGCHEGFGWIKGEVIKLESRENFAKLRVPHVGWNNVKVDQDHNACGDLFEGLGENPTFYFVHSYHLTIGQNAANNAIVNTVDYGTNVTASIQKDNIYGVQFHPEKSQQDGLKLLENFVKICSSQSSY